MRVALSGLALLLTFGMATAHAQRQFGGKIGPTIAAVHDSLDQNAGYGRRVSLGGGGFVVLPLGGRASVQIEGLLTPKGGKLQQQTDIVSTLILDYFEIPLLGRIAVTRSSSRSFYIFGGPSAGIRINAKQQVAYSGSVIKSGYIDDIRSDIGRFELGLIAGGGVDVGSHGVVDARYFWGLTDVNRDASDGNHVRNRGLTILVGLRF
jgi:Outer membrane protein beta-barrel domain